jgi:NADPH:quinone reductase-like Zn-dependent oxidoreductase
MFAVFITKAGGPGVVQIKQKLWPQLKNGQALVKVYTAGLNYADIVARRGLDPDAPKFPFVPGYEFAGIIEKTQKTNHLKPSDRVFGLTLFGAQAQYIAVNENQLFRIPENMSYEQAAAIPVNYLTAYYALFRLGNLRQKEALLIHSCAGGVGTAAVQLALTKDAEIFGTTSSDLKTNYLINQGVHHPINYKKENFSTVVKKLTGGRGIDIVLDPVGGSTFKKSWHLLAPGGRIICYGVADLVAGARINIFRLLWKFLSIPKIKTLDLIQNNRGAFGLALNRILTNPKEIETMINELLKMFDEGRIKPEINRVYGLNEVVDAHTYHQSGKSMGKLILRLNN